MQSQVETFSGSRLEIGRDYRGLTQTELAKRVAASVAQVSNCEKGKNKNPEEDLVGAFGEVLGFKPSFFYRPLEDPFLEEQCSFRHRRSTPVKVKAQIRAHGTLIGMVIRGLQKHLRFPAVNVPRLPVSSLDDVELAAEGTRQYWALGLNGPIWQLGRVLERAGVIVVENVVTSSKVDAFSRRGKLAVIFLNGEVRSSSRWNFDIAHECGHLVMHGDMVTGDLETERQADRFASAFLMPRVAFSREFLASSFSWKHVFDLKRRWHSSAAAIIRRAYDLELIGAVKYRQLCQYISFKHWNRGEPAEPAFQSPELLSSALAVLGKSVDMTINELCGDLGFTQKTFQEITGVAVPQIPMKLADVLPMRSV